MIPLCPKCHVGLMILNFKEVEVDFCQQCQGVWLDAGELEELMTMTGASADDPLLQLQKQEGARPQNRKYLCPRCDHLLHEITVPKSDGGLRLDRCPGNHGLWFDDQELKQLLMMFPARSGTSKTIDYLNELFGTASKA